MRVCKSYTVVSHVFLPIKQAFEYLRLTYPSLEILFVLIEFLVLLVEAFCWLKILPLAFLSLLSIGLCNLNTTYEWCRRAHPSEEDHPEAG